MTHDEVQGTGQDGALQTLAELAHESLGQFTPEQCLRGEQAILRKLGQANAPRSPWITRSLWAAAALPVLLGAAFLVRHMVSPDPLAYQIENGYVDPSQNVHESGMTSPTMRFSDGTEVRLAEGAHARIRFVTAKGAALALDRGQLHAEVVHSAQSEWRFDAGPFSVRVTGTSFGLNWQPEQDSFDLRLEHGSVTVVAPVANDPIPVRAGQWLTIHTRSNEVLIRDLRASTSVDVNLPYKPSEMEPQIAQEASDSVAMTPALTESDRARPAGSIDATRNWANNLKQGKLDLILKDAQSRGLEDCLAKVSSDELSALADAARYTRHNDIARKALMAQRRRFGGSRKATEAAFLLGKLAQTDKNEGGAISLFDTYLTEAPSGTYASEALGRKMAIVQHSSGSMSARPFAQDYLTKYPHGTYASAARAILQNP